MIQALIRAPRRLAPCLFAAVCVSGCHDASGDPTAVLLTEETHGALGLEVSLPSLPDLAARTGTEATIAGPLNRWVESWSLPPEEAAALRADAYGRAVPGLAPALGTEGVAEAVAEVGRALDAAASLDASGLPPVVAEQLEQARSLHAGATEALEDGRLAAALEKGLSAADAIHEVAPHGVASALVARAENALEAKDAAGQVTPEALERGRRLLKGARYSLDREEYARAIRRAYYACQLLGVPVQ